MTSDQKTAPSLGYSSHTAGPWSFDQDWARIPTIFSADGQQIIASIEKSVTQRGIYTARDLPERKANARLIAAAPDMYEALKEARHQLVTLGGDPVVPGGDTIQRAVLDIVDEALAKATGGQS